MTVYNLRPGRKSTVQHIDGSEIDIQHLASLGIYPGTTIVKLKNGILAIDDTRLAMGRQWARKIKILSV